MDILKGLKSAHSMLMNNKPDLKYLLFFITSRCDASCKHCFFHESTNKPMKELTLDEIEKISKSMDDFLQLTLTGGDAALRDDLPDIAEIFVKNNKVMNITIGTNGNRPEKVKSHAEKMLKTLKDVHLTVDLSMDGLDGDHDFIRNTPGIFNNVKTTFYELVELKKFHKNLNTCIDITVSAFNHDKLLPLYEYIRDQLKPDIINTLLIRGNPRDPKAKNLQLENYENICTIVEEDYKSGRIRGYSFFPDILNVKDILLRRLIIKTQREDKFQVKCTAGTLTGVIYPEGDVYPCELLNKKLGSLREENYDFNKIWKGKRADEVRKWIRDSKCYCIHQCFLSNNILFNPRFLPQFFKEYLSLKSKKFFSKKNPIR
ncbi:radical SAM protein [bacterium]|nr:radical SAM protein [bacterium]